MTENAEGSDARATQWPPGPRRATRETDPRGCVPGSGLASTSRHRPRSWLALLAIAVLLAGCAGPAPTSRPALIATPLASATPTLAPSPMASATPVAVTSTATPVPIEPPTVVPTEQVTPELTSVPLPPSPLPGIAALVLPPGAVRTIDLLPPPVGPGSAAYAFPPKPGGPPSGPYVYIGSERLPWHPAHLVVVDLGGGSTRAVPLPTRRYEHVGSALVDGRSLVLLLWQQEGPQPEQLGTPCSSNSGHPIDWRLLVTTLGADGLRAGAWRTLDTGVSARLFADPAGGEGCADPVVPAVAVADGRVAYAVDHATAEHPAGSHIVVRSLSDGSLQRRIDTVTQVIALALSAASVSWSESPNALVPSGIKHWRVMRAPLETGVAAEVPLGESGRDWRWVPSSVVLDGDAVLTSGGPNGYFANVTVRSEGASVVVMNPTGVPGCRPLGAASGVADLACMVVAGDNESIATWSPTHGLRIAGVPAAVIRSERVTSGWLAWISNTGTALSEPVLMGVPLSALAAADR